MTPIALTLKGFTGIRLGTGKERIELDFRSIPHSAQLVALVGQNGKGKTTILDNMHPYRLMPSSSSTLGPNGFSYWEHIDAPLAEKEFLWEHSGLQYKSAFSFKSTARTQRADYYLFVWDESQQSWSPVTTDDGTVSDGKADTYDRCVNSICGIPEAFFTSQFSAQGRRSLSSYVASEIKSVLASILNHDHFRALATKANTVGRMLRLHLDGLQDGLSQVRSADTELQACTADLCEVEQAITAAEEGEAQATNALDTARRCVAELEGKRDAQAKAMEERDFLKAQIQRLQQTEQTQRQKEVDAAAAETARLNQMQRSAEEKASALQMQRKATEQELVRLRSTIGRKDEISKASATVTELKTTIALLNAQVKTLEESATQLKPLRKAIEERVTELGRLQATGSSKVQHISTLKQTASLVETVPCKGQSLQLKCPLLRNANEAQGKIAEEEQSVVSLRDRYRTLQRSVEADRAELAKLDAIEAEIEKVVERNNSTKDSLNQATALAGLMPMVEDAERRLPELTAMLDASDKERSSLLVQVAQYKEELAAVLIKRDSAIAESKKTTSREISVLEERISKLELPLSEAMLNEAKQRVTEAINRLDGSRKSLHAARDRKQAVLAKIEALHAIRAKAQETAAEAERIGSEIAKWKLLEKGLGNDGLIALSIDDAGPEISAICNDLLKECYGGRFSVRIETQRLTNGGNMKETFEVIVTDNHRGGDKPLKLTSGGEEVWVNECLTRAIALHVAQAQQRSNTTLFSDEADGALDAERKRNFMLMKRRVLQRGGYHREYFISHTPELCEMADYVIDVGAL